LYFICEPPLFAFI